MAAATAPASSNLALGRLALAYLERLGAGDGARAAVVLGVFVQLYNLHVEALRAALRAAGATWQVPNRLTATFDSDMRQAMVPALVFLTGDTVPQMTAVLQTLPAAENLAATWYTNKVAPLLSFYSERDRAWLTNYATWAVRQDVASIATQLWAAVEIDIGATPAPSSSTGAPSTSTPPSTTPGSSLAPVPRPVVQLPGQLEIKGWWLKVPLWAWIGLGAAVAVGGGILVWTAVRRKRRREIPGS